MNITNNEFIQTQITDEGRRILVVFEEAIPKLNQIEREKLLSFGEGMLFMKNSGKSA